MSDNIKYNSIEEALLSYECFLKEVYDYTKWYTGQVIESNNGNSSVTDIEGAEFEFFDWKQGEPSPKTKYNPKYPDYSKYPESVIKRALEEVPIIKKWPESSWRYKRDFENSPIKLGVLVKEAVGTSGLIDLGLFMRLLKEADIESYIDFESQQFCMNSLKSIKHK